MLRPWWVARVVTLWTAMMLLTDVVVVCGWLGWW